MMVDALQNIKQQINTLSLEEQLSLMTYLASTVRAAHRPRRKWLEIGGIAPNLLDGEDAQEWVTRTRREDTCHREDLLKR